MKCVYVADPMDTPVPRTFDGYGHGSGGTPRARHCGD